MLKYTAITALLLSLSFNSLAQIYKTVDDQGNISFGDAPQKNSKQLEVPKSNTVKAVEVPEKITEEKADSTQVAFKYTSLKITSPADDTGVAHGAGDLSVSISTAPALRSEDSLRLLMDGKAQGESASGGFQLSNIDRGSHKLQAVIVDPSGKVLKKSSTITVHIMRPSAASPSY